MPCNSDIRVNCGSSIAELEAKIDRFAKVSHYVLIVGERGTGKTTIARTLHEKSCRSNGQFVNVNCASFTSELLESELFGYEKGAFTGAVSAKAGLFETAAGGTLFLDEIGELTLSLQAKLLKAVEEKRIRRVGGTYERQIDVRVIAATSRNLIAMVADGSFRPDLFDRLNVLQFETVPLRNQREKIREMFLKQFETEWRSISRGMPSDIDKEAFHELERHRWDGNYRELLNFATRLAVEAMNEPKISARLVRQTLEASSSATAAAQSNAMFAFSNTIEKLDRSAYRTDVLTVMLDPHTDNLDTVYIKAAGIFIEHALKQSNGNLRKAARSMGSSHSTLLRILKLHKERSPNRPPETNFVSFGAAA